MPHVPHCLPTEAATRGVLCKKVFLEISQNSQENTCAKVTFLNKVAALRPVTLLKKRLWHRCFPVNFVKFLRTPLFTEHLWWLLLCLGLNIRTIFFQGNSHLILERRFLLDWYKLMLIYFRPVPFLYHLKTPKSSQRRCSTQKKLFWKTLQNLQENTFARVSFLKKFVQLY